MSVETLVFLIVVILVFGVCATVGLVRALAALACEAQGRPIVVTVQIRQWTPEDSTSAAQAREIAKECQEEAIRSAVSAVAQSPDPR